MVLRAWTRRKRRELIGKVRHLWLHACEPVKGLNTHPTGVLELTHNHGTENDPSFQGYSSGNTDPGRGFGHIAISTANVEKACARFEELGVPFKKKLTDGKMRHIAFILDPDGYATEL